MSASTTTVALCKLSADSERMPFPAIGFGNALLSRLGSNQSITPFPVDESELGEKKQ